jgi:hypothetical protein
MLGQSSSQSDRGKHLKLWEESSIDQELFGISYRCAFPVSYIDRSVAMEVTVMNL